MKAPRGTLFLQLGSALLALMTVALYQWGTRVGQLSNPKNQHVLHQRYERVLGLLYADRPVQAAELLATLPVETIPLEPTLLRDEKATYPPEQLFYQIATLFGRHARRAAFAGEHQKAELLLGACRSLQRHLERTSPDESPQTRQRRTIALSRLQRLSDRMNQGVDALA